MISLAAGTVCRLCGIESIFPEQKLVGAQFAMHLYARAKLESVILLVLLKHSLVIVLIHGAHLPSC
jgi:hypothetical protein